MPIYTLRCDAPGAHIVRDEFRHRAPDDLDFGPCAEAECAGHMRVFWGESGRARKFDAFTPIELDGVKYDTRDAWMKRVGQIQRSNPDMDVNVEANSPRANRAAADEIRHSLYRDNNIRNEGEYHARLADLRRSTPARRRRS